VLAEGGVVVLEVLSYGLKSQTSSPLLKKIFLFNILC